MTVQNGRLRDDKEGKGNLSETDETAVLDWLMLIGETDPDKIRDTIEACAAKPATLARILSGGKSTGNGESKATPSSEQEVTLLQRIADRGVNVRLENGKPIYESGQEMSAAQMTWIEENEQQIIAALKTRDAG